MSLRCAVAGLNRGRLFAEMILQHPGCELVAVCDEQVERHTGKFTAPLFNSFEQMLDETQPDMVAIITPGPLHPAQTLTALEAGVNVLVETPNVYSVEQAKQIVSLAREKNLKYMLSEDYIYMPWCRRLMEIVAEGELGEIIGAAAEYTHDCRGFVAADEAGNIVPMDRLGEPGIKPLWRLTHLPPLSYSSHTLGPLLEIMQDRCVSVAGMCGGRKDIAGIDVAPLESAVFQTQNGAMIRLTNGFIVSHPMTFSYGLYGTKGSIRMMDYGVPQVYISRDADGSTWQELDLPFVQGWAGGTTHLPLIVNDYLDAVINNTPVPFDEARSMDFCLPGVIAHESAMNGGEQRTIPLF